MDADQLTCIWVQFKGALKTWWGRFREQHLVQCEESDDQVDDTANEQYGDKQDEFMHEGDRPATSAVGAGSRWGNASLKRSDP